MKKIISILFITLLFCVSSKAQSMLSLEMYMSKNSNYMKDPITLGYVLKRCGAVYLYVAAITKDKEKETSNSFRKAYQEVTTFTGMMLMQEMNWSEEEASKSVFTDIDNMMNYYEKDGNDSFARTGNYIMDNYIGADVQVCNKIVNILK